MKKLIFSALLVILFTGCQNQEAVVENTAVSPSPTSTSLPEATSADVVETAVSDATTIPTTIPTGGNLPPYTPIPRDQWATLDIDTLHEQIFAELMRRQPELATELGVADHFGIDQAQLNNVSDDYLRETDTFILETLALLENIEPEALTPAQKRSNDILIWDLQERVRSIAFKHHNYLVMQLFSIPNNLPEFMANVHPIDTLQDAQDFVARLEQVKTQFTQLEEGLHTQAGMGILPPRFVFDHVLGQLRGIISPAVTHHSIYTSFDQRLAALDLPETEKQALLTGAETALSDAVYPAYNQLIDTLTQLQAEATDEDGVWKLPDGEDYYAYTLYHHTTTDMTADEIHALGLQEVERISQEMSALLTELGYSPQIPVGIGQIYGNAGGIRITNDAAREEVFAAYEAAMAAADDMVAALFNIQPKAPLIIERVPAIRETSAPGAYYYSPPLDGSRPGIFFINAPQGGFVSLVGVPTLAFHEGVPGHHFQKAIQRELTDVPTFRRASHFTAYAEGWALYVEKLAWEQGYYEDDPYGNYGRLQSELFRAVRLVVDTGIHAKGWTRQEAIDYMSGTLGWSEGNVAGEVERYIVWPGQAASYKIGELTMLRLRDEARQALGDRFDLAEFHTVILQNGDVPLEILEEIVEAWIEEVG